MAAYRARQSGERISYSLKKFLIDNPPTHCACCKKKINYLFTKHKNKQVGPSLDKIIPTKGYTIKNTRVLHLACNRMKQDMTIKELEMIKNYIKKES